MSVKLYEEQGVTLNLIPVAEYITEFIKKISARNMRNVRQGSYQMKITKESDREITLASFKIDPKINTTCWLSNNTKIIYKCIKFASKEDMDLYMSESDAYTSEQKKDSDTEEVSAVIHITEVMTDDWDIYDEPYSYIGGKKIYSDTDLEAIVQHELSHCYVAYKRDIEETEDAILQLHKIREMRGVGLPVYILADCIYRYCVEDERNAFVQQHYIEYQVPGQYMSTSVWKIMDDSYRFFTEKFVPLHHTASERTLNRKIYDKIYSYLKPVSAVLVSKKLKKINDSYEFTCELTAEILKKIAVFKRRLLRASNLRNSMYEGILHKPVSCVRY